MLTKCKFSRRPEEQIAFSYMYGLFIIRIVVLLKLASYILFQFIYFYGGTECIGNYFRIFCAVCVCVHALTLFCCNQNIINLFQLQIINLVPNYKQDLGDHCESQISKIINLCYSWCAMYSISVTHLLIKIFP